MSASLRTRASIAFCGATLLALVLPAAAQSPAEEFESKMGNRTGPAPLYLGRPNSASGQAQTDIRVIDVGRRAPRSGQDHGREDDSRRMESESRRKSDEAWEKRTHSPAAQPQGVSCTGSPPVCSMR